MSVRKHHHPSATTTAATDNNIIDLTSPEKDVNIDVVDLCSPPPAPSPSPLPSPPLAPRKRAALPSSATKRGKQFVAAFEQVKAAYNKDKFATLSAKDPTYKWLATKLDVKKRYDDMIASGKSSEDFDASVGSSVVDSSALKGLTPYLLAFEEHRQAPRSRPRQASLPPTSRPRRVTLPSASRPTLPSASRPTLPSASRPIHAERGSQGTISRARQPCYNLLNEHLYYRLWLHATKRDKETTL